MASLLQCEMKVDVAVPSSKDKRIVDESSLSELVFKETKKHQKIREKKSPLQIKKVSFLRFFVPNPMNTSDVLTIIYFRN